MQAIVPVVCRVDPDVITLHELDSFIAILKGGEYATSSNETSGMDEGVNDNFCARGELEGSSKTQKKGQRRMGPKDHPHACEVWRNNAVIHIVNFKAKMYITDFI